MGRGEQGREKGRGKEEGGRGAGRRSTEQLEARAVWQPETREAEEKKR